MDVGLAAVRLPGDEDVAVGIYGNGFRGVCAVRRAVIEAEPEAVSLRIVFEGGEVPCRPGINNRIFRAFRYTAEEIAAARG